MIIHDGKYEAKPEKTTSKNGSASYGGFSNMLEYEAYQRKKTQTGKKTLVLTLLLSFAFILFIGALIVTFIYQAYRTQKDPEPEDSIPLIGSETVTTEAETKPEEQTAPDTAAAEPGIANSIRNSVSDGVLVVDEEDNAGAAQGDGGSLNRIGITCVTISDNESCLYRVPKGVMVYTIEPSSNAAKSGLQRGDIIESFNTIRIYTMNGLIAEKQKYKAGDTVTLTVYRGDTEYAISFALEAVPME